MKKLSIIDIVISIGALLLVVLTLAPAVARLQRTPEDARCQSNMRRWGEALALYTNDNDRRYPTNRTIPGLVLTSQGMLSPRQYDENGNPIRFTRSINWVEALFPYIIAESKKTGRDWESIMRCPNASTVRYPAASTTAGMTYMFNYNLLEFSPAIVRDSAKTMMIREMDRLMESACRPINNTTGTNGTAPQSPFLTKIDIVMRSVAINNKLHGQGSHILFADGHVMYFEDYYFPSTATLSAADSWDPQTQQWWNWVNKSAELNKAIAVTP